MLQSVLDHGLSMQRGNAGVPKQALEWTVLMDGRSAAGAKHQFGDLGTDPVHIGRLERRSRQLEILERLAALSERLDCREIAFGDEFGGKQLAVKFAKLDVGNRRFVLFWTRWSC